MCADLTATSISYNPKFDRNVAGLTTFNSRFILAPLISPCKKRGKGKKKKEEKRKEDAVSCPALATRSLWDNNKGKWESVEDKSSYFYRPLSLRLPVFLRLAFTSLPSLNSDHWKRRVEKAISERSFERFSIRLVRIFSQKFVHSSLERYLALLTLNNKNKIKRK